MCKKYHIIPLHLKYMLNLKVRAFKWAIEQYFPVVLFIILHKAIGCFDTPPNEFSTSWNLVR